MNAWERLLVRLHRSMVACYPGDFRAEFGEEMQEVFTAAIKDSSPFRRARPLQVFWRELRLWPGSLLSAHLDARRKAMSEPNANSEKPLPLSELFAALFLFLLPMASLAAAVFTFIWGNGQTVILFLIWGLVLIVVGYALLRGLPRWSLPYLGFLLFLAFLLSPLPRFTGMIYPYFLERFGPRILWTIPQRLVYSGVIEVINVLALFLGALLLVNLLRLLPYTRRVWMYIRRDWTSLSFLLYGMLVFVVVVLFEEYRGDTVWQFIAWAFLALGALLYLSFGSLRGRILALLIGSTGAFWMTALAKWVLIPLQAWPDGYPVAPTPATRWVESGNTLISWFLFSLILLAPALLRLQPPEQIRIEHEQVDSVGA